MRPNILSQQLKAALFMMAATSLFVSANADELPVETPSEKEAVEEAKNALNLGSMVVTASGFAQEVKDAPASISVVGQETISEKPFTDIGDVLKDIEGVNIKRGGKTGGVDIGIRGMDSKYTLLMVDGKRLSQNSSGARPNGFGDVDSAFIPPSSAIERIEVVRGPMSTLYGSDALGGVVNVITKKVPDEWGGQVSFSIEEPTESKYAGGNTTSFYLGGPIKTDLIGLALMGSFQTQRNAKGSYESAKGVYSPIHDLGGMGKRKNFNYGARLSFTPENQEFVLSYDRGVQRYDNSDGQLGTLNTDIFNENAIADAKWKNDPSGKSPGFKSGGGYADHLRFDRERVSLSHQADLDFATVESSLLWDKTRTIGRTNPMTVISGNQAPFELEYSPLSGQNRDIKYTNIIFDNKWMFSLGDHFISAGMQYRQQKFKDTLENAAVDLKQYQWALFLEDEWMINDSLIATLGLRYDKNEDYGSHFSPRAYLVWNIDDHWQIKGGVSKAFRAPDIQEMSDGIIGLSGQGTIPNLGNSSLKPEKSTSAELGFSYTNLDDFSFNATTFYTKFKDRIESTKVDNCHITNSLGCVDLGSGWSDAKTFNKPMNVDDAKLYGLELGMRYQILENVGINANYTYTHSNYRDTDNRKIPFSKTPQHMLNLKANWVITGQWNVWAEAEYRAKEYRGLQMNNKGKASDHKLYYRSYALMNIGASYKPTRDIAINFGMDNIFNKNFIDYQAPEAAGGRGSGYQNKFARVEDGRKLWIKLNYEF